MMKLDNAMLMIDVL